MSPYTHSLFISTPIFLSFYWLYSPDMDEFTLQIFCLSVLFYFALKYVNKKHIFHLDYTNIDEITFITFPFLLLIGKTGGLSSFLFPFIFVFIFLLSISSHYFTSLIISTELIVYFYLLTENIKQIHLVQLISIFIVTLLSFYTRKKYLQAK